MGKFKFNTTDIEGVYVIEPTVYGDERGYFMETYSEAEFKEAGLNYEFVQDNQSSSRRGVLRGLHFQKTHPQAKLVRVLSGEVLTWRWICELVRLLMASGWGSYFRQKTINN